MVVRSRGAVLDGFDRSRVRVRATVPILIYHQISAQPLPYSVDPRSFALQMAYLARNGYESISLDTLLAWQAGGALPRRPFVLSFDDGFRDCIDYAVPILERHGFTATFFVVAGLMGQTSRWMAKRGLDMPLIGWPKARELVARGFSVGAHGRTHASLAELGQGACRDELRACRELLEEHLGAEVWHLAYPHGSFNSAVSDIAAETGYRSACSVRIGLARRQEDPLALPRVPVTRRDSLADFGWRLRTGFRLLDTPQRSWLASQRLWRRVFKPIG